METQKKIYKYDYPEQRELSSKLLRGERAIIANATGYSIHTIQNMCNGSRKMKENVKIVIEKLIAMRKEISETMQEKYKPVTAEP